MGEIKYFDPGMDGCEVSYWPEDTGLKMTKKELPIHDAIAEEVTSFEGELVEFWSQDKLRCHIDPATREVTKRVWKGPYEIKARIEWPDSTPETREEGIRVSFTSRCWIPRVVLESKNLPVPLEGDVIRFWNIPYFNEKLTDLAAFQSGLFFNVVDVDTDGHIGETANFVGFWLTLQRRTDYAPERRVFDEQG